MPRSPQDDGAPLEGDSWTDLDDMRKTAAIPSREEHRRLKAQLHQQLIASMDLAVLGRISREELRTEVRRMAEELCQRSSSLLNRAERERLVNEVLDETFGLGPLEPLMADPTITDILINGHNVVYVERNGRLEQRRRRLHRRPPPAAHHPAHRRPGRPARGRDQPDGRWPAARRQPHQRHHPAAGPGRRAGVDPPLRRPAASDRRPGEQGSDHRRRWSRSCRRACRPG